MHTYKCRLMRAVVLCSTGHVLKLIRAGSKETVRMIMRFGACLDMITVRNKRVNGRVIISMGIKSLMHPLTNLLILECMYVCG